MGLISREFMSVTKNSNPLSEKVTSDHITKIIDNSDVQDKRDRDERKQEKIYNFLILFVALIFVAFLIIYLKDNEKLLTTIITAILSFAGGFGIGVYRTKNTDKTR
jgi:Trk-type K+ transport system membrane component